MGANTTRTRFGEGPVATGNTTGSAFPLRVSHGSHRDPVWLSIHRGGGGAGRRPGGPAGDRDRGKLGPRGGNGAGVGPDGGGNHAGRARHRRGRPGGGRPDRV